MENNEQNEPIAQETHKVFRSVGALAGVINWAMFSGLVVTWIAKAVVTAGFVPNFLMGSILFTLPFSAVFFWWHWRQNYLSENPTAGEKFYRFLPLLLWLIGFFLGVVHFI